MQPFPIQSTQIDRDARRRAALLLRRLAAGRITNYEFEDRWPCTDDVAVREIFEEASVGGELTECRFVGRNGLDRASRRQVARWILFLRSDLPYEWPITPPIVRLLGLFVWLLLGFMTLLVGLLVLVPLWSWIKRSWYAKQGDITVWPFVREEDLQRAMRECCLLRREA